MDTTNEPQYKSVAKHPVVWSVITAMVIFAGNRIVTSVDADQVISMINNNNAVINVSIQGIEQNMTRISEDLRLVSNQIRDLHMVSSPISLLEQYKSKWDFNHIAPTFKRDSPINMKLNGMDERDDNAMLTEFLGVDPLEVRWCAAFVNAVEIEMGREGLIDPAKKYLARAYLEYGTEVSTPDAGDIVVLWRYKKDNWRGHVGYYHSMNKDTNTISIYGGNQGSQISIREYPLDRVLGYRRP